MIRRDGFFIGGDLRRSFRRLHRPQYIRKTRRVKGNLAFSMSPKLGGNAVFYEKNDVAFRFDLKTSTAIMYNERMKRRG